MGLLWSMLRNDFPRTEDQPPLARAIERFDKPDLPSFRIEPGEILNIGDPAPALAVSSWVKGEKVEKFEPGK